MNALERRTSRFSLLLHPGVVGVMLLTLAACHASSYEDEAVRVDDLLFGPLPSQSALEQLGGEGFRTVLTVQPASELDWDEKKVVEDLGMRFIAVPMPKPIRSISEAQLDRFDEAMETAPRPMLLHCSSGNRVAGLYAVWLAERKGVPPEEAVRRGEAVGMTKIGPLVRKRLGVPAAEK